MEHKWEWFERWQFTACAFCGIVKGVYPKSKPCRGWMKLRPMERSEPLAVEGNEAREDSKGGANEKDGEHD